MPLPQNSLAWPPKALGSITPTLLEWSAWYEGTPEALRGVYSLPGTSEPVDRVAAQRRGGIGGFLARMWWGRASGNEQGRSEQVHVPIASDLAQASADLLYSEAPTIELRAESLPDGAPTEEGAAPTQHPELVKLTEQLELLLDQGLVTTLAEGAEVGAALGGRYHRITWDDDDVFVATIDADQAWPEFRWGRLVAVTFWWVLADDNGVVWRHLERHELTLDGLGLQQHGLYQGRRDNLGTRRALGERQETAGLESSVDADGYVIDGRTPGLLVEYVPNQKPNRRWRRDPLGRNLGRSDLDGVEQLMDALDETYSSLMRDVRLGRGRIIVPDHMLTDLGPGKGAAFDTERAVFTGIAAPVGRQESGSLPIEQVQFNIRVDEHLRTMQQLVDDILRSAGYSGQTFGEGPDNAAMTATEVQSRERRSYLTRSRKLRHESPAVRRLLLKVLRTQRVLNRGADVPLDLEVSVVFGDAVQDSPLTLAQTAQTLLNARAASTETRVRMVNPDWNDEQVREEVQRIMAEEAPEADPFSASPFGSTDVRTTDDGDGFEAQQDPGSEADELQGPVA